MKSFLVTILFVSGVCISSSAAAQITCPAAQNGYANLTSHTANQIHVYMRSDFHTKFESCDLRNPDESLSLDNAQQTLMEAIEIWNAEARGAHLVYRGTYGGAPKDLCGYLPSSPNVFVSFEPGCNEDANGTCIPASAANVRNLKNAPSCNDLEMRIFGDRNTNSICDSSDDIATTSSVSGAGVINYILDEEGALDLVSLCANMT